jgi:hypothetical protein
MDTRPAEYLRHRMLRFARAIKETREHFLEISAFGRYPASSPYYERSGIQVLLDSMNADPGTREEFLQEFQELDDRLTTLERELGGEYRRRLREELSLCTDRYHSAVCHASLGLLTFESDHELFCRDRITVLVHELEKDHDLHEVKNLIRMLDQNLFCSVERQDGECAGGSLQGTVKTQSPSDADKIEG